jgi:hypothetical protein
MKAMQVKDYNIEELLLYDRKARKNISIEKSIVSP